MEESGFSTVQKPGKILACKGQKQIDKITSAERGQNITVVCVMSAIATYMPPAFLFPRKNMRNPLMHGSAPGSKGFAVESGWMASPIFVKWLHHFQEHVHANINDKVILVLDNHASHRAIKVIDYAR